MRLLIAHNEYGSMSGEENALRALAGLFESHGHRIDWFLRSSAEIQTLWSKARAFASGFHSASAVSELRELLKRKSFDAALVQNIYPFLSPSIFPVFKEFNIPVVMRCPNYRLFCPNGLHLSHGEICERCIGGREYWCAIRNCEGSLFKSAGYALRNAVARITGRILKNVDLFIVLSEFQRQRFIAGGISPEKLVILPNIAPTSSNPLSKDPGDLVTFVGRISPEKGIEDFVDVARMFPDIPFAVAGAHDRMPELAKKSPSNIHWKGFITGRDLDELFQQSRMLVFPGRWFEGFPNVVAKAMGVGKPVIATRLGALPEIVGHERTGLLFDPGNIVQMARYVRRLYDNPNECLTMGKEGRKKAEAEYSQGAIYQKLSNIFEGLSLKNNLSLGKISS
jgi:glycosyltransferase involved in cell wall biosynthesis